MGKGKKKSGNQPKNQNQQDPAGSGSQQSSSRGSSADKNKDKKNSEKPNEENQSKQKQTVAASSGPQPSTSGPQPSTSGDNTKDRGAEVKKEDNKMKSLGESFAEVTVTKKPKLTSEEWEKKKMAKKLKNKQQPPEQATSQQPSTSQIHQEQSASRAQPNQPARQSHQQQPSSQSYQQQASSQSYQQQPTFQGRKQQQQQYPQTSARKKKIIERGTLGRKLTIETNYLALDIKNMPDVAYHYDVKVEPFNITPNKEPRPIPKKLLRHAFNAYVQQILHSDVLPYDGVASAYSPKELNEEILNRNERAEVVFRTEDGRENKFRVTVKPTADVKVDLKSLRTYQKDRIFDKPMRALQCIEVVLGTACLNLGVRAGRSFFQQPRNQLEIGDGYELWLGLYQAAMLCDVPLLNVDVSHKSFPTPVDLVAFYNKFGDYKLTDYLRGLSVTYNPPRTRNNSFNLEPKRFKFFAVAKSAKSQDFMIEQKTYTVKDYFLSKGYEVKYPDLPCLHVGKPEKNIYIPLELITIPPGQAILRKDNDNQIRKIIRFAATSTADRKTKIMNLLQSFRYYSDPVVSRFGINVGREFTKIESRVLNAPMLQYRNEILRITDPGAWNSRDQFLSTPRQNTHQWVILNMCPRMTILKLQNLLVKFVIQESMKAGMSLGPRCTKIEETRGTGKIKQLLKDYKKENISLVFVIIPFGNDIYAAVKQEAELTCGIVTQCIKSETIYKETGQRTSTLNPTTVRNILLKVNAKLNGINHTIANANLIQLQKTSKIMFVGADVSHPSPLQKNIPSIVGVVASHDLNGFQYNMQYRLQTAKEETILDMQDIFSKHLAVYKSKQGVYPDIVIYYRDGVSDGQFKTIEHVELNAMRAACSRVGCAAKFTCIIVVKRHHTRFFPLGDVYEGNMKNVLVGTVVDRTIIHPGEEQFFMVSHKSSQGTAKPTRYNVIVDDSNIPIDDLQALTYNLCHLFPRCNRSVSYPTPAYLSHLVGLRGRAYIQGRNLNLDDLKREYRPVSDEMKANPMHFV